MGWGAQVGSMVIGSSAGLCEAWNQHISFYQTVQVRMGSRPEAGGVIHIRAGVGQRQR